MRISQQQLPKLHRARVGKNDALAAEQGAELLRIAALKGLPRSALGSRARRLRACMGGDDFVC